MTDDTKHLLSSPTNAQRIRESIEELNTGGGVEVDPAIFDTVDTSKEAVERGVSIGLLHLLIECDSASGKLTWKPRGKEAHPNWSHGRIRSWNSRYAGTPAISSECGSSGYKGGSIMGVPFKAHRVIWAMSHGRWPENHIDHINGDTFDNRIKNLRDVSNETNTRNARYRRSGKSIMPGVQWLKRIGKWQARIGGHDQNEYLGVYDCVGVAINVRRAAQIRRGYMPNHGKLKVRP